MAKFIILCSLVLISCRYKNEKFNSLPYHDISYTSLDTTDYLLRISDQGSDFELGVPFAFVDKRGDTVISLNKYHYTWTDTLKSFAIVSKSGSGMIGIDKEDNTLFEVFSYDNGPDYLIEGLFRVIRNKKIGYADRYGVVVIPCQFDCAYYFDNGKAKVSKDCKEIQDGEYYKWESDSWFYIDKTGKPIN